MIKIRGKDTKNNYKLRITNYENFLISDLPISDFPKGRIVGYRVVGMGDREGRPYNFLRVNQYFKERFFELRVES